VSFPWSPSSATGVGSLPFDDRDEAARVVVDELPEFVHLADLPSRGPGADMIGRGAALLVDVHVDLQPSGWRVVDRPGIDEGRARSMLDADLEALEIATFGYEGPLKVQVAGPLTLAAGLERTRGDRMLADYGARRDLAESLAEGAAMHVSDLARRVPGASVVLQLDEPSLPAVLAGSIPTISGYGRLRSVAESEAESLLSAVISRVECPVVVHCCAANPPFQVIQRAGAAAVSIDVNVLDGSALDQLRVAVDAGLAAWPGVVPSIEPPHQPSDAELADRVRLFWRRLDQNPKDMAERTVITPTCGLAGASRDWTSRANRLARSTARAFAEIAATS
jgi:methionine synthase II (cobalamin-independent)